MAEDEGMLNSIIRKDPNRKKVYFKKGVPRILRDKDLRIGSYFGENFVKEPRHKSELIMAVD